VHAELVQLLGLLAPPCILDSCRGRFNCNNACSNCGNLSCAGWWDGWTRTGDVLDGSYPVIAFPSVSSYWCCNCDLGELAIGSSP
jgi:hypothetical protein